MFLNIICFISSLDGELRFIFLHCLIWGSTGWAPWTAQATLHSAMPTPALHTRMLQDWAKSTSQLPSAHWVSPLISLRSLSSSNPANGPKAAHALSSWSSWLVLWLPTSWDFWLPGHSWSPFILRMWIGADPTLPAISATLWACQWSSMDYVLCCLVPSWQWSASSASTVHLHVPPTLPKDGPSPWCWWYGFLLAAFHFCLWQALVATTFRHLAPGVFSTSAQRGMTGPSACSFPLLGWFASLCHFCSTP